MEQLGNPVTRDLVTSASIFSSAVGEVLGAVLERAAAGRVSMTQSKVLTLLAHTEGIGVSDVATFLGVSAAAASKTVARLVEGGFVERTESPDDRRMRRLSLTPAAWEILSAYEEGAEAELTRLFRHLDDDWAEGLSAALDSLSLMVAEGTPGAVEGGCFRCGIHFRRTCLLRGAPGNRMCYRNLGIRRRQAAVA